MAPLDTQEETYPCTLCDKSFSNVDAFCKHLGSHMDGEDCDPKVASQVTKIATPIGNQGFFQSRSDDPVEERSGDPYSCSYRKKNFQDGKSRETHRKKVYLTKDWLCSGCGHEIFDEFIMS